MKFETPISPQDVENIPGMQNHLESASGHPVTDIVEHANVQPDVQPATDGLAVPEVASQPEAVEDHISVTERIKDAYYWAGAKFTIATTMGENSNSPVWRNVNALKRRKMVERGIGILACAKLGMEVYKASKGLQTAVQSGAFLPDLIPGEIPVDLPDKQDESRSRLDYGEIVDGTLEYSQQGLEGATDALLNTPRVPKVARAKAAAKK